MANTKVSGVYGVNENGEVVAAGGTGSTTVKGFLPSNDVPVDDSGRMVIAGLSNPYTDATGNTLGITASDGSRFDLKNIISAVSALAGRKSWPTKGITATWPLQYSRIPKYWQANKSVAVGDRRIVSHSSVAAGSDIPFDQTSTTSTTRYFIITCTQAGVTGSSKPTVSANSTITNGVATEVTDNTVKWLAASVYYVDPVGGNNANTGNTPTSPFLSVQYSGNGNLYLLKCGTTNGTQINTAGKVAAVSASGVSNTNMVTWYGDFAGAGAPQTSAYLNGTNWEFFQVSFTACTGANNVNLSFFGCKFQDRLSLDWTVAGEYGHAVIEDCVASNHATATYDGITITIRGNAALDRLAFRNVETNGNARHGMYIGMGTSGTFTAASAGILRFYEETNCAHNLNGLIGVFVENFSCTPQPLNRIVASYISNNDYLDNSGHACTYGGFGRRTDTEYQNVFAMNKAARNNLGTGGTGTGGMQLAGWYRGLVEYNESECNGSNDKDYDGTGLYMDVVSTNGTTSDKDYTVAGGCSDIIVRFNVSRGNNAVRWVSSTGRWLPVDRLNIPASQGISLYKTQGADVYGNVTIGNGFGFIAAMAYGVDIHDNLSLNNDTAVFFARDGGGNKARNNTVRGGYIGLDQADQRVVVAGATATFAISADPYGVWNVAALTSSAAILTDLQLVYEVNGTGLGVVMGGVNASSAKLCVLSPFSKASYIAGELEINAHRNLATSPRAKGSVSANNVSALKSSPNNGSAWGTPNWVSNNKYANGLLSAI